MDQQRFDALTRHLATLPRRRAVGAALAAGAAAVAAAIPGAEAKKRKKKKTKGCPAGRETCGSLCCSPDRDCAAGVGCQCKVQCGEVCCPNGQHCVNANLNECGCGTCPAGCACLAALGGTQLCFVNSCEDVQPCGSVYDCPAGTACLSGCNGRFCVPVCEI